MKIKGTHTYIGADNKQEPVRKDIELDVLGFNNLNLTGKNIDEFYVALYFNNAEDVVTTGEVGELADYKFNNVSAFYNGYANGPDHIREIEIRLEDTDNYYNRNIITAKVSTMNGATEEFVNQLWNELDSIVEAETGSSIDDNLGTEKEKADQKRAQAEEDELKIDGDYPQDVIDEAQKIFDTCKLVGADIYIDKDGVSVLVKDTVNNIGFWFDIFPSKEGDLEGDWNQYIFHNNFGDQVRSALQNNGRFFEAVFEVAENYAMEKEAIKWNDETNKYEFKTESKKVNKKENKKGIGRYLKEDFYDGDGDYDEADWEEEAMGEEREDVEEYIISFEPGELYDQYHGEFITEDKEEADDLFDEIKEEHKLDQVDQYIRKVWEWDRVNEEYYETDVEVYFNAGDELEYYDESKKTEGYSLGDDKESFDVYKHTAEFLNKVGKALEDLGWKFNKEKGKFEKEDITIDMEAIQDNVNDLYIGSNKLKLSKFVDDFSGYEDIGEDTGIIYYVSTKAGDYEARQLASKINSCEKLEESKEIKTEKDHFNKAELTAVKNSIDTALDDLQLTSTGTTGDYEDRALRDDLRNVGNFVDRYITRMGESKKVTEDDDEEITKVVFRKDPEDEDIIAVFPEDKQGNNMVGCYVHLGQHTTMSIDYYNETVPATPEEYADLKRELENIGYNVEVVTELNESKKVTEAKPEEADKEIWEKVEHIVDAADNELGPDQSNEYQYDEHIKFVIYRDFEYEDIFEVYTYVDGEVQEDLDTGDVHLEDLDATMVDIVKKLQSKEVKTESRYIVYDYADGDTMQDEEEKGLEPSQFTIYDNKADDFYYDELGNNPVFDKEEDAEEYIKKNLTETKYGDSNPDKIVPDAYCDIEKTDSGYYINCGIGTHTNLGSGNFTIYPENYLSNLHKEVKKLAKERGIKRVYDKVKTMIPEYNAMIPEYNANIEDMIKNLTPFAEKSKQGQLTRADLDSIEEITGKITPNRMSTLPEFEWGGKFGRLRSLIGNLKRYETDLSNPLARADTITITESKEVKTEAVRYVIYKNEEPASPYGNPEDGYTQYSDMNEAIADAEEIDADYIEKLIYKNEDEADREELADTVSVVWKNKKKKTEVVDNENKVIVYQIDNIENCDYAFMDYAFAKEKGIDLKDYKKTAEVQVNTDLDGDVNSILELVFSYGNTNQEYYQENPEARSISVSDILEYNGKKYYVDSFGFEEVVGTQEDNKEVKTEAEDMTAVKDNIEKAKEDTESTEQEIEQVKGSLEVLKTDEEEAIAGYDTFVDNSAKVVGDKLANAIDDEMQEIIQDEKDHIEKLDTIKTSLGESKPVELGDKEHNWDTLTIKENEITRPNDVLAVLDRRKIYELNYTNGKKDLVRIYSVEFGHKIVCKSYISGQEFKLDILDMLKDGRLVETDYLVEDRKITKEILLGESKEVTSVPYKTEKEARAGVRSLKKAGIEARIEKQDDGTFVVISKYKKEEANTLGENKKTEASVTKFQTLTVDKDGNEMLLKDVSYNNACSWLEKELAKAGSKVVDTETKGNKTIIKADNKTRFEYDEEKGTLKRLEETKSDNIPWEDADNVLELLYGNTVYATCTKQEYANNPDKYKQEVVRSVMKYENTDKSEDEIFNSITVRPESRDVKTEAKRSSKQLDYKLDGFKGVTISVVDKKNGIDTEDYMEFDSMEFGIDEYEFKDSMVDGIKDVLTNLYEFSDAYYDDVFTEDEINEMAEDITQDVLQLYDDLPEEDIDRENGYANLDESKSITEAIDPEAVKEKVEKAKADIGLKQAEEMVDTENELTEGIKKEIIQYAKQQGLDVEKLQKQGELNSVAEALDNIIGEMVSKSANEFMDTTGKNIEWDFEVKDNNINVIWNEV